MRMTKEQILADLDYVSAIAKDGATTPLLGGPIGLMWGVLVSVALMGMWAILTRIINVPYNVIWIIWVAFAVIGGFGSAILGKRIDNKVGANSVANRVESYVWIRSCICFSPKAPRDCLLDNRFCRPETSPDKVSIFFCARSMRARRSCSCFKFAELRSCVS